MIAVEFVDPAVGQRGNVARRFPAKLGGHLLGARSRPVLFGAERRKEARRKEVAVRVVDGQRRLRLLQTKFKDSQTGKFKTRQTDRWSELRVLNWWSEEF